MRLYLLRGCHVRGKEDAISRFWSWCCPALVCLVLLPQRSGAVILYSTPNRNTTPDPSSIAYPDLQRGRPAGVQF